MDGKKCHLNGSLDNCVCTVFLSSREATWADVVNEMYATPSSSLPILSSFKSPPNLNRVISVEIHLKSFFAQSKKECHVLFTFYPSYHLQ